MTYVDLKLLQLADGSYDLIVGDGDFLTTESMDTTVLTSVLSDARASETEVGQAKYRGGWLPNVAFTRANSQLGSLLWLMAQRRRTTENLNFAIDSVEKSLSWLIEDGIAKSLEVLGTFRGEGAILTISITSFSGETDNVFVPLWKAVGNGA